MTATATPEVRDERLSMLQIPDNELRRDGAARTELAGVPDGDGDHGDAAARGYYRCPGCGHKFAERIDIALHLRKSGPCFWRAVELAQTLGGNVIATVEWVFPGKRQT